MVLRVGLFLLLGSLLGCAGSSPGSHTTDMVPTVAADAQLPVAGEIPPAGQYTGLTEWLAWLEDPGEPGVDYDPNHLTISYLPGAKLPKGVSAVAPAGPDSAANQSNAILRQDKSYETLTDTIAATYGLRIAGQVYWGRVLVVGFELPAGADGDAILTAIRRDFAGTVEFAGYSMLFHKDDFTPNDPDYTGSNANANTPLWGLHKIRAGKAWENSRGKATVRIAVVDTGVRITHDELLSQVLDPQVYFPASHLDVANDDNSMEDDDGHGTFIAGEIAAEANNNQTLAGLAHLCQVIPIKITNAASASDYNIIQGCVLGFTLGARAISLSFGDYHSYPPMETMVNQIWDGGAIFVSSAGNDGDKLIGTDPHYPSDYANSISVGSTDVRDIRSSFSNYGQYVDIAAPGEYIKSCKNTGDSDYVQWSQGTSFASPLVAAAAALLWSYDGTLTNSEVRNLLESTAKPCSGFTQGEVGRLDIGGAMAELAGVRVYPPKPDRLLHSGVISLTPVVSGEAERVECYLNSQLIETRTAGPWTFTIDTTGISFGYANVQFSGYQADQVSTTNTYLLVDNTFGNFPVLESFEESSRDFYALDVKNYAPSLLEAIKSYPPTEWTTDELSFGGNGLWNDAPSGAYDGFTSEYFGTGGGNYDSFEIDALISRRLDFTGIANPTMVLYQHYNIEDGGSAMDRAQVYVTTDYGQTFELAKLSGGGDARFTGYQPSWVKAQVDLSDYAGQKVHLALVFESDPLQSGEDLGQPSGWWVDKITVSMDYIENMPAIGAVSVPPYATYGSIPASLVVNASVTDTDNVATLVFKLDCVPLGVDDPNDVTSAVLSGPYAAELTVPTGVHNQVANLLVQYYDGGGVPGPVKVIPVYIHNQIGDTDLDGLVDDSDLAGFPAVIGLTTGQAGFVPFYDCNQDGQIDERDAALIGYNYGDAF